VLVTSRERLQLQGEHAWTVPSLDEDDGEALFTARARALRPAFSATPALAELCNRLDNLPLALELAAARIPLFSPEQLLERLGRGLELKGGRDADPRQQTLDATIRWSYDLLAPDEQQLFTRLAVFAGGCVRGGRGRVRRGGRHAAVPDRQEPRPQPRIRGARAVLDAGDDPRVRGRRARSFR
jgi:predicted ATPase